MSSDGFHITIPTFEDDEDDDFRSTPIPFGRSQNLQQRTQFGHSPDSPVISSINLSERTDRSYFHSREDSGQSFDSERSFKYGNLSNGSGRLFTSAHSSQTSLVSSAPTKKSSFASIKNAFKSSVKSEKPDHVVPPVPPIDSGVYSTSRNPFSRSQSALAHASPSGMSMRRPSVTASPPQPRPSTPTSRPLKRGNHSYSGSLFHVSDVGSDVGSSGQRIFSPPPVPRNPFARNQGPSISNTETGDKASSDPRTPAEYALHAVFMRFVTAAEIKIEAFVKQSHDREPLLASLMGPGVDPLFDELLESFSRIAQKHAQPLVTSILRWRKTVGTNTIRQQFVYEPSGHNRSLSRTPDAPAVERERRSLAAIYVMCRALIVVLRSMPKDALGQAMGNILEETTFDQLRKPNVKLLQTSANHRSNAELFGTLLGHVSNVRFESVTDRFISELKPIADGQISKDLDLKYENLVKSVKHVQIKVWPPESFEEGADFLERFARCFEQAHGQRLKIVFAETLVHLLHPIGKTAQAEVNHPVWAKAIDAIFPKARDMMSKPRYWHAAYPLVISSLCVAPQDYFLRHWTSCFEISLVKLKEKTHRAFVMNGIVRLFWTYLYRCREPSTTVANKMDNMLKGLFPNNRPVLAPVEETLDPLVAITHFVLSRHFEYGIDLTMSLMQETMLQDITAQRVTASETLSPDRMIIALRAILLSLTTLEKEHPNPVWPSSSNYSGYDFHRDYQFNADLLPESFFAKPGIQDFFNRCGPLVTIIANISFQTVGGILILDEQWTPSRLMPSFDDQESLVVRHQPEGPVAYPRSLQPYVQLLQTCFESWPRCLHPSMPVNDAIDMLIRGVMHIEPSVGEAATNTLNRLASKPSTLQAVVSRYTQYLFSSRGISREGASTRLPIECLRVINLWHTLSEKWLLNISASELEDNTSTKASSGLLEEVQAGGLFMLSWNDAALREAGLHILQVASSLESSMDNASGSLSLAQLLEDQKTLEKLLSQIGSKLEAQDSSEIEKWLQSTDHHSTLSIISSRREQDQVIWRSLFPSLLRMAMDHHPRITALCRDSLQSAILRYHSVMSSVAEISGKGPLSQTSRTAILPREIKDISEHRTVIEQWQNWIKLLCATALPSDTRVVASKEHVRIPSDLSSHRDRISSARGLFRHIIPFLSSDHSIFRDAAVFALGNIDQSAYQCLLEDLQAITRHIYDELRSTSVQKAGSVRTRRQDRLYTVVAHIYRLTAPFIKDCRSLGDSTSLHLVLRFVRETQTFLSGTEVRIDWELQPLRKHFCGIVQHLFNGLAEFKDSDRFISPNARLKLFRLCEEWCLLGKQSDIAEQRHLAMQASAPRGWKDPKSKEIALHHFEVESNSLSTAAAGAMAALCEGAFYSREIHSSSPITEPLEPLHVLPTLDRLNAMLSSPSMSVVDGARAALRALLVHPTHNIELYDQVMQCALLTPYANKARLRVFEVVSEVVLSGTEAHHFTFAQLAFLALLNINHVKAESRRQAFNLLETVHERHSGILSLAHLEAAVGSSAPNVYLHAQRQLSEILANEHSSQAYSVLAQGTLCLTYNSECSPLDLHSVVENALQFLEPWVSDIDLMPDGYSSLSTDGRSVLRNVVVLTARFMDQHPDQIQTLWARIVDDQYPMNSTSTVSFLMEQATKCGDSGFVACATRIVACLSRTPVGQRTIEDLCSFIEPYNMVTTIESSPDLSLDDDRLWNDEFSAQKEEMRQALAPAELAWMFLGDVALERAWELIHQLPAILHALFTHFDHRVQFVQQHARGMIFQTLRAWLPGMDGLPNRSTLPSRTTLKQTIEHLVAQGPELFWVESDSEPVMAGKMKTLCDTVLQLLEPLAPQLRQDWGRLALEWGTSCPIRAVACRSLQLFRVLMPRVDKSVLASLMGRLSNTIADTDENIQSFGRELILTLQALATSNLHDSLLPLLFWCAAACLSTTVEQEYRHVLELLECLLDRLDLDDLSTIDALLAQKPNKWVGEEFSLQALISQGLRSASVHLASFRILCRLTEVESTELIDPRGGRVRDLYTICVVWCLHSMDCGSSSDGLIKLATDVAHLAELANMGNISRILSSFAKSRFRTKDDFARQAISALREQFATRQWNDVVTLLLSLVLNRERWICEKAMQVLKTLFQHRDARHPHEPLSSELLMPLLRLLQTDLAPQALEVLDVHMPMSHTIGPAAKDVLRMSMHENAKVAQDGPLIFGIPQESGWCVPDPVAARDMCRRNAMNVFDSCKMAARPSIIQFEPDLQLDSDFPPDLDQPDARSLGELVNTLHDLNSFFQSDVGTLPHRLPPPTKEAEDRVADILARSLTKVSLEPYEFNGYDLPGTPPTPFIDAFDIGHANGHSSPTFDFDRDSSESESGDNFTFDHSVSKTRAPVPFLRQAR